jgi:ribose-phosphate pyrophosphokinase
LIQSFEGGAKRVTSLADKLNIDFAIIHKDSSNIQTAAPPPPAQTFLSVQNNSTTFNSTTPKVPAIAAVQNLRVPDGPSLSTVTLVDSMQSYAFSTASGGNYRKKVTGDGQYELTLVGDVTDRIVFILDDLIDSVQSFIQTAEFLKNQGAAKDVYIVATHGIVSGDALSEIQNCTHVKGLIVTNTYPIPQWKKDQTDKLSIIDISGVLAEAIRRTHNGESISYLFDVAV